MRRQRRRMRGFQQVVPISCDMCGFLLRVAAPEHENQVFAAVRQALHERVGKLLPAPALMGSGLRVLHTEHRVEQQYALLRPMGEIARYMPHIKGLPKVLLNLSVNIAQGGSGWSCGTEKLSPMA